MSMIENYMDNPAAIRPAKELFTRMRPDQVAFADHLWNLKMARSKPMSDLTAERWKNIKLGAENTRLQSVCADALTMLDAMHVCCRGHECERRAGKYNAEMDDSCRLHDVRETLARGACG